MCCRMWHPGVAVERVRHKACVSQACALRQGSLALDVLEFVSSSRCWRPKAKWRKRGTPLSDWVFLVVGKPRLDACLTA